MADSKEEKKPAAVAAAQQAEENQKPPSGGFVRGFRLFLHDYGIVPLALGVVIGSAVNDLVKTLVDGLITPLISLIFPDQRLQGVQFVVRNSTFKVGAIIDAIITFLVIAWVVYIFAKLILHNDKLLKK